MRLHGRWHNRQQQEEYKPQLKNVNVLPSRSRKNAVPSGAERSGPDQDRVRVRVS